MSKQSDLVSVSQGASGDPLFIDTVNDRVGVGTSSPATTLDVVGSAQIGANATKTKFYSDSTYSGIFNGATLGSNESFYMGAGALFFYGGGVERLRIDAAGRVTMPYQPAFAATYSGLTNIPSGTSLAPTPTNAIFNTGNHYSASTGRFTAPVAGLYEFNCAFAGFGSFPSQPYWSAELWINGVRTYIGGWNEADGGYAAINNTFIIQLNAGDYAQLGKEFYNAGQVEGGSSFPVFSGRLIG